MNRTPRPVPGSRKAAVANAYGAARRIAERQAAEAKRRSALNAMAAVHAASQPKPQGPKRDAKGRFVRTSA